MKRIIYATALICELCIYSVEAFELYLISEK